MNTAVTTDTATVDSFVSMRLTAGINNECLKNSPVSEEDLESLWDAICEASDLHSTPGMCYLTRIDANFNKSLEAKQMSILQELNFQYDEATKKDHSSWEDYWASGVEEQRVMAMLFLYYSLGGE